MPFFMDIHLVGKISVEDTRRAHLKDLSVQEKYGVIYHQYWFNEEAGTVYCLMEGPDKEACAATHLEANGFTACQIVEVEGGMYDLFMGAEKPADHGPVRTVEGNIDPGYRFIFSLNITMSTGMKDSIDFSQLKLPQVPRQRAQQHIVRHGGKEVGALSHDCLIAVFHTHASALDCAHHIQQDFLRILEEHDSDKFSFNMGISVGEPITETTGFFTQAIQMSRRLCLIAGDYEILTSRELGKYDSQERKTAESSGIRKIKPSEKAFLNKLLDIIDDSLSDQSFGVFCLSRRIGMSQPQLYRKVHSMTGRSPVAFIRDIRLNKALSLIRENRFNISEIALEVGYSSPSYFSKCFHNKYGVRASAISV